MHNDRRGFTLIELLVVIAIIGLLATIILAALQTARLQADDTKRMAELRSMETALEGYNIDHNAMPINRAPLAGYPDTSPNFLEELVADGYLPETPHSPSSPGNPYWYYDYGPSNSVGAIVVTVLEAAPPSVNGYPGTCRPFPAGLNWCDQSSDDYYCLCLPY